MPKKTKKRVDKRDEKGRFLKGHSIGRKPIGEFEGMIKSKCREHLLECLAMIMIGRDAVEKELATKDVSMLEEMIYKTFLKGDYNLMMKLLNKFVPDVKPRESVELDTPNKNVIQLNYKLD